MQAKLKKIDRLSLENFMLPSNINRACEAVKRTETGYYADFFLNCYLFNLTTVSNVHNSVNACAIPFRLSLMGWARCEEFQIQIF